MAEQVAQKALKCVDCGNEEGRMYWNGLCDLCIMKVALQLQMMIRELNQDVGLGDLKLDLEHYPIEDHPEFYGIEWDEKYNVWRKIPA